jgi:hypothetical protein
MGGSVKKIVTAAVIGAAIATGVGVVFAPSLVAGATFAGLSGTAAYFATNFAISAVLGAVGSALAPKPEQFTSAAELRGRQVMSKQAIQPRDVVYGEVKKSGTIVFMETTNDNQDLHVCVTLAGHEINKVQEVYFNDAPVRTLAMSHGAEYDAASNTTPDYSDNAKITAHLGLEDQVADSRLVSRTSMTTNHRLRSIAYIYGFFSYDQDVFANGLPNISCLIQGKKVYDPRSETTAYSNNAALCIRDYISNSTYGLGASDAEIDDASFIAAANICDETVVINPENAPVVGINYEKRYTINGVIDTSKQPRQILNDMLTSCGGTIYYSNGKWHLKVGAYVTPTTTITNDDLRGSIKIQTRNSGSDQFNAVKGIFVSPDNNWQPTDYPQVTSSTFESEDGGDRKYLDLTLPYTTSVSTSQRLAKQVLYRNREQIVVTLPCKLTAFQYEVGDTVQVTNERFGWTNKVFEVVSWNFAFEGEELGVDLVLKETSSNIYAWDETVDETSFTFNNTSLPNAFDVNAPGISVSDELRVLNEEAVSVLIVDVTSAETFTNRFEVEARKNGDTEFVNLGQASGNRFELLNVADGFIYEVRARSINTFGVRSTFTTAEHQVVGKTLPPADVTNLTGNLIGNQYLLTWSAVPDLDLSHYRVRFAAENGVNTYQNSVSLVPKVARPATSVLVPARNGTYFVKAIDKLGLASENPATIVLSSNIQELDNFTGIQTLNEHPDFVGSFDDVVEIDEEDRLVLNTSITFDSVTGNFDDADGLFDGGSGNVDASGFYYFDDTVDLGATYLVRAESRVRSTRLDYVVLFDSTSGNFDDRAGFFDGDVNAFDDVDVEVQARITTDDPSGTPTWSDWKRFEVSDFKARGLEFRAKLSTTDDQATPAVSELGVSLYMGEHVESGDDITSGTGSYAVTFDRPYKVTPAIGIGAQDLQTGDYYRITSKSRTGFTITFYDSADTIVSRTFDWVAKGYGREVA